jgi:urate oxidase
LTIWLSLPERAPVAEQVECDEDDEMEETNDTRIYTISYGKAEVPVYRVYANSLVGITPIPESSFAGRANTLFAAQISVEVFGDNFLPAYTRGDNSEVVATDSMKNFILQQAFAFQGSTIESFLDQLGRSFLGAYSQMERLKVTGRELAFDAPHVPTGEPGVFGASEVLLSESRDDYALATLEFARVGDGIELTSHRCGRIGLHLLKVTGSSFSHFVRDEFTTLPERVDRPLFTYLDVYWQYADVTAMLEVNGSRYVAAEQVRDLVSVVFHQFVSESIQHLVHEMGLRMLARYPQLSEVTFEAENRTPDPVAVSSDTGDVGRARVYTSPFSAYGLIKLTMQRDS